jgi:DedD protein
LKQETRYRVTGSLFLLAMAVIFLPMLFDGAGLPTLELEPLPVLVDLPEPEPTLLAPVLEPSAADLVEAVEALRDEIDPAGFHAETDTRLGEPILSDVRPDTVAWAVQVASFADVDNARVFRARLRGDGYEAFLSTARTGTEVRTRVAVGPLLNREQAVQLQAELSSLYRVNARLMDFST